MKITPRWHAHLEERYIQAAESLGFAPEKDGLFPIWRLVLEGDGNILGIGAIKEETPTSYRLTELAVPKALRGHQIGRHVLLFLETKARSISAHEVAVLSPVELVPFFSKCGYKPAGDGVIEEGKTRLKKTLCKPKPRRASRK